MDQGPVFCSHCGERIPPPVTARRRYCKDACRVAAMRRRRALAALESWEPAGIEGVALPPRTSAPIDEQIARAVLEARSLSGAFLRLGREARPALAWRCEETGAAIDAVLDSHFGRYR